MARGLYARYVREAEVDQNSANVRVFELDRLFASAIKEPAQLSTVRCLVVRNASQFGSQHGEVIGDRRFYLFPGPVIGHVCYGNAVGRLT